MTSARVLATQDAKAAADQLVQLSQQLKDQLAQVIAKGDLLADPNQWDGSLAAQWRGDWGNDKQQIQNSTQQLDDLQGRAKQAVEAIIQAGGG